MKYRLGFGQAEENHL